MTKTQFYLSFVFAALAIFAIALFLFTGSQNVKAAAGQLPATVASSSLMSVGSGNATTIFATSTCAARIVTTVAQPVMITFDDAQSPTGVFGHLQAASTTVAYDAAQFGCGKLKVFGFNASTSITVTDAR